MQGLHLNYGLSTDECVIILVVLQNYRVRAFNFLLLLSLASYMRPWLDFDFSQNKIEFKHATLVSHQFVVERMQAKQLV
jgi:hypothetical protein